MLNKTFNGLIVFLVALNGFLWEGFLKEPFDGLSQLEIHILDVGQGDSILIKTPDGAYGLIDGGKGKRVLSELGKSLPFGQRKLTFVIATHPDADHIEGLIEVVKRYEVENLFWQKSSKQSDEYSELKSLVDQLGIKNYELRDTHDFRVGCCTEFDVIWPKYQADIYHETEVNEISIAVIVKYKDFEMFTAGDLGEGEIKAIEDWQESEEFSADSTIDVLKVGHHGSSSSSDYAFLDAIKPKLALISVGENNSYGHPHQQVLDGLGSINAKVFRTDLHGRILLQTDGESMQVFTEKGENRFTCYL